MGKVAWLLLLVGILEKGSQAQLPAGATVIGETHADISTTLMTPSVPQPLPRPPAKALVRYRDSSATAKSRWRHASKKCSN